MQANRIYNTKNPYQGERKRVLCICSAGLLRSPTAAVILSQEPFNYNTRAAGIEESYALIPVDNVLIHWAEEIVCMTKDHEAMLKAKFPNIQVPIYVLNVPDNFGYMNPKLQTLIREAYEDTALGLTVASRTT